MSFRQGSLRSSLLLIRCTPRTPPVRSASRWSRQSGGRFAQTTLPLLAGASFLGALGVYLTTFDYWSAHADSGIDTAKSNSEQVRASSASPSRLISMNEINAHDSIKTGIWVAIQGEVYDVTDFVDAHPGGKNVIIKNAGKDVTDVYTPVHPANAIAENLDPSQHLGQVDPKTVKKVEAGEESEKAQKRRLALENLPEVGSILNLDDFEVCSVERV
jgi:L-lactate dehydrogenase (cytochrome)